MFRKKIDPYFGLIFEETSETRIATSIHMFFMFFNISVLWLDKNFVVVDKVVAKKWHPIYISKYPAKYTVELHSERYLDFSIGDQLLVTSNE